MSTQLRNPDINAGQAAVRGRFRWGGASIFAARFRRCSNSRDECFADFARIVSVPRGLGRGGIRHLLLRFNSLEGAEKTTLPAESMPDCKPCQDASRVTMKRPIDNAMPGLRGISRRITLCARWTHN
jgi:hypothetical protein